MDIFGMFRKNLLYVYRADMEVRPVLKIKEEELMSTISQMENYAAAAQTQTQMTSSSDAVSGRKNKVSGKTVGEPKLSDAGAKYYEELKKKYSNLDFILVSTAEKQRASAQAGSYANPNKMVVLIDEEKIERMATDENYRKQYEAIISNAANGLSQMSSSLSQGTSANVKGYGMQVHDNGTVSYFAVIDKSLAAQRERMAEKAETRREERRDAAKKAEKERREERLDKARGDKTQAGKDEVTITASSIDELIKKINDVLFNERSNYVMTEEEKMHGQNFDFRM